MHDYRWRLGLTDGERKYDDLEKRLATPPPITVPTIHDGRRRQRCNPRAQRVVSQQVLAQI
jgi:hypothetical protein